MSDLKNALESLLFSSGKRMGIEELSKLSKEKNLELIKSTLEELKKELDEKNSSLMLVQEGDFWKLAVREKYLHFVRKIVTQTELPKSILETLAVVAFKAPVLQSDVIKIRTNKAYAHLDELDESGYILREKKGRTRLIKLTQKFYEYFDIPEKDLKQRFKSASEAEKELETMPYTASPKVEIYKDEFDHLEVYETTPEMRKKHVREKAYKLNLDEVREKLDGTSAEEIESKGLAKKGATDEEIKTFKQHYKSKGLFQGKVPKELEERIDKRVEEIVSGKEESEENEKEVQIEETEEEITESEKQIENLEKEKINEEVKSEESALESEENNKTKDESELTEEESEEQTDKESSEEEE